MTMPKPATALPPLTSRPAWKALAAHHADIRNMTLRQLFADDPRRGERLAIDSVGVYLDYSKNRVTDTTLALLVQLAAESGLREHIDAMFRGDRINHSEDRAVLHVALRAPRGGSIVVDGKNVVPDVHAVLDRMAEFADRVRSGTWKGHTGKRIRNVINVGIGGSDLGPVMAYEALKRYSDRAMTFRFVSNVDGTDFAEAVQGLDPAETLFVISSKDVHDAGDDDQREHRAGLVAGWLGRRRVRRVQALRRGVDQRRTGVGLWNRYRQHVRILGLGWRALFDGLRHRAVDDARRGTGEFPRAARGIP